MKSLDTVAAVQNRGVRDMNKDDLMKKTKKKFVVNGQTKNKTVLLINIEKIDTSRGVTVYEANPLCEEWCEYDDHKSVSLKREISCNGKEKIIQYTNSYDNDGNLIQWKNSEGDEMNFDKNGVLIHSKISGHEYWHNSTKDYKDSEIWSDYDKNGNEIHWKRDDGLEQWNDYDKDNNLIHDKDNEGNEYWYEYEFDGNIKTIYSYTRIPMKDMIHDLFLNILIKFSKLKK